MEKDIAKELAQLRAIRNNWNGRTIDEDKAKQYNDIVAELETKGLDVSGFRIIDSDLQSVSEGAVVLPGQPVETSWSEPRLSLRTFRTRLDGLIDYLESQPYDGMQSSIDGMAVLARIGERFSSFVTELGKRQRDREPFKVEDEYDVQDLLRAILRLHFEDVRKEEWIPSYAGKASKMDFLLTDLALAVEVKYVRDEQHGKKIGEEITVDVAKYEKHPDCNGLVALIYDPNRHIENPPGLKKDLEMRQFKGNNISVYICN